jgi:hypothetical protein
MTDIEKLTKSLSDNFKSKVDKDINLSKRYTSFDEANENKKQRIRDRDERKQKRYNEYKERIDAKRERYADKMEGKGILPRGEAMARFDELRGIKGRSAQNLDKIMKSDGEMKTDDNGDRVGFELNQDHIAQGMSDVPEDPTMNEGNPASRFMLDTGEGGFGNA